MTNRDRDGRRLNRQDGEPAWTDWSGDQQGDQGAFDSAEEGQSRDLPTWSDEDAPSRRRRSRPEDRSPRPATGSTPGADSTGRRVRLPELSRTLTGERTRQRTQSELTEPELAERASSAEWWQEPADWQSNAEPGLPAGSQRSARARSAVRSSAADRRPRVDARSRSRQSRSAPSFTVPPAIAQASIFQDRMLLGVAGATVASLALMTAIVGSRIGDMPPGVVLHLNAAGAPDLWGTRSTLWRLPLAAAMLTIMNLVAGAFMLDRNVFLARFLVASSLLVNVLTWIAVVLIFW